MMMEIDLSLRGSVVSFACRLLGLGLVLLGCACSDCVGEPRPCPTVYLESHPIVGGEISWTVGERTGEFTFPETPSDSDSCHGQAGEGFVTEEDGELITGAFEETLTFGCGTPPIGTFFMELGLGDPRGWEEGTFVLASDEATLSIAGHYTGQCEDVDCEYCNLYSAGEVTIVVEEAVGVEAPFPEVVTEDFRRVYTVSYSPQELVTGYNSSDGHSPCSESILLDFWGRLVVTADDFVPNMDRMCPGGVH